MQEKIAAIRTLTQIEEILVVGSRCPSPLFVFFLFFLNVSSVIVPAFKTEGQFLAPMRLGGFLRPIAGLKEQAKTGDGHWPSSTVSSFAQAGESKNFRQVGHIWSP